jgi:hypothetical protein
MQTLVAKEASMRHFFVTLFILGFVSTSAHAQRRGGPAGPSDGGENGLGALHFRPLGPEGNRVASITGVPGDAMTVYIGAADGGIWKTSDAGIRWQPVFDDKDVSVIGALGAARVSRGWLCSTQLFVIATVGLRARLQTTKTEADVLQCRCRGRILVG